MELQVDMLNLTLSRLTPLRLGLGLQVDAVDVDAVEVRVRVAGRHC